MHEQGSWGGDRSFRRKLHILKLRTSGFHAVYLSVSIPTTLYYEHIEQEQEAVQAAFSSFLYDPLVIPGGRPVLL